MHTAQATLTTSSACASSICSPSLMWRALSDAKPHNFSVAVSSGFGRFRFFTRSPSVCLGSFNTSRAVHSSRKAARRQTRPQAEPHLQPDQARPPPHRQQREPTHGRRHLARRPHNALAPVEGGGVIVDDELARRRKSIKRRTKLNVSHIFGYPFHCARPLECSHLRRPGRRISMAEEQRRCSANSVKSFE